MNLKNKLKDESGAIGTVEIIVIIALTLGIAFSVFGKLKTGADSKADAVVTSMKNAK